MAYVYITSNCIVSGVMQGKIRQYRHELESARPVPEAGGLGRAIRVAAESEQIGEEVSANRIRYSCEALAA